MITFLALIVGGLIVMSCAVDDQSRPLPVGVALLGLAAIIMIAEAG